MCFQPKRGASCASIKDVIAIDAYQCAKVQKEISTDGSVSHCGEGERNMQAPRPRRGWNTGGIRITENRPSLW